MKTTDPRNIAGIIGGKCIRLISFLIIPFAFTVDALINIPGQPSVSCQDFQAFAAEGQIVEAQCGIVQGFVAQTCGCAAPDGMTPTSSPVAGSLPTSSLNPGPSAAESEQSSNSGSSSTLLAPSCVFVMVLSTIATMAFSFLTE